MKHTPGPWKVGIKKEFHKYPTIEIVTTHKFDGVISGENLGAIVKVVGHSEESEANASLVSAAPELLEACKRLLEFTESRLGRGATAHHLSCILAEQAIAKAEGK